MDQHLRTSPNFALALSMDGRAYVAKEVEPYTQYWLSERERHLFALFARRGGMRVDKAVAACAQLSGSSDTAAGNKRILKTISGMREAGILLGPADDTSRYASTMAANYLAHRPFPREVANHLVKAASVDASTHVLDLAGGPGSLALELARSTPHVSMMELSKGFVSAARAEAKRRGVMLNAIHDSCNRLTQHEGAYDVVTVSQALHWLDDVLVCKGISRLLRAGGSFFVVHGSLSLRDEHPLSYVLGDRTPLGDKAPGPFSAQVEPLLKRLALLFDALDTPDVDRIDPTHVRRSDRKPIVPRSVTMFRQERPIGEGFARAFLSDAHIAATSQSPENFWAELSARCKAASEDDLGGAQEWALLHFGRGDDRMASFDLANHPIIEIGPES